MICVVLPDAMAIGKVVFGAERTSDSHERVSKLVRRVPTSNS